MIPVSSYEEKKMKEWIFIGRHVSAMESSLKKAVTNVFANDKAEHEGISAWMRSETVYNCEGRLWTIQLRDYTKNFIQSW